MITIRKSDERGHFDYGWLKTYHTFSFAEYQDAEHMGFRSLRVINEDWVQGGAGFGTHPHRNMEIITYIVSGTLGHEDSAGNRVAIHRGDVQRMSAGRGIRHSEMNHSQDETVHLIQIWIQPDEEGLEPEYGEAHFSDDDKRNQLRLLVSHDGRNGSMPIHQDVDLYASILEAGQAVEHHLSDGRHGWLQVIGGSLSLNGQGLSPGDGAALSDEPTLSLSANQDAEFLLFDCA